MKSFTLTRYTQGVILFLAVLVFGLGSAFAQANKPTPTAQAQGGSPSRDVMKVDCDDGDTIQEAVDEVDDGGIIRVSGTCTEQVLVNRGHVEIVGIGGAIVSAPNGGFAVVAITGGG